MRHPVCGAQPSPAFASQLPPRCPPCYHTPVGGQCLLSAVEWPALCEALGWARGGREAHKSPKGRLPNCEDGSGKFVAAREIWQPCTPACPSACGPGLPPSSCRLCRAGGRMSLSVQCPRRWLGSSCNQGTAPSQVGVPARLVGSGPLISRPLRARSLSPCCPPAGRWLAASAKPGTAHAAAA